MPEKIKLIKGDITACDVDTIVNAANTGLLGGGGVDGAIHRAAGPELLEACRNLNGCETGEAKITPGFRLKAGFVIHTPGPVWRGGNHGEAELLASSYKNCLRLAAENNCTSIAFPNISTGVYGFPKKEAAGIAIGTVVSFLEDSTVIQEVTFVCFDDENLNLYKEILT